MTSGDAIARVWGMGTIVGIKIVSKDRMKCVYKAHSSPYSIRLTPSRLPLMLLRFLKCSETIPPDAVIDWAKGIQAGRESGLVVATMITYDSCMYFLSPLDKMLTFTSSVYT